MWSEVVWQGVWYVPSLDPWGDDCQLRLWTFVSNATTLFVVTFFPYLSTLPATFKENKTFDIMAQIQGRYSGFKVTGMIKGFFWVGKFGKVGIFGSFCRYRKALYFWSLGISLYLEFFCFLSFITFVLRNLCSGTHRRNRIFLVFKRIWRFVAA